MAYKSIYLMGFSMGAASSIIEAAKYKNVNKLIVVSPPASFAAIENKWYYWNESIIPAVQKFGLHLLKFRCGNIFSKKISPVDVIKDIAPIPTLVIHGTKDPIIFKHHVDELFARAQEPKQIVIFQDGLDAEDLFRRKKAEFIFAILSWLK
jgi:uncharacterized protein